MRKYGYKWIFIINERCLIGTSKCRVDCTTLDCALKIACAIDILKRPRVCADRAFPVQY